MPTLYCPECGYNLTGLTEHRCPECGQAFDPEQLEHQQVLTAKQAKTAILQVILMPFVFAFVTPFMATAFTSWMRIAPVWLAPVLGLLGLAAALALPVWHGAYMGKRYALSRLYRSDAPGRSSPRPTRFYILLFAALECVLMVVYLAVPMGLVIYLVI